MSTLLTGGCPVVRPLPLIISACDTRGITLQTDHHLGAANTDEQLIREELGTAAANGDRVLLGGDLFDLILPTDRKRWTPNANHPRLRGRVDLINEVVEMAEEVFGPYADLIDGVGIGNHETAAERNHHVDAVKLLLKALQLRRSPGLPAIQQLGYTAYIEYGIFTQKGVKKDRYVVWYTHGSGTDKTAAGALSRLSKQTQAFAADLYWSGHSHARGQASELMYHAGKNGGGLISKDVRVVVTGSYLTAYGDQSQDDMKQNGRKSNYASEMALRPHGPGGARILLHFGEVGFPQKVQVIQ